MSRTIQIFNLIGVLALAGLCVLQWRANRRLNLDLIALEKTRLANLATIAEREKTIAAQASDLDDFHQQVAKLDADLKETSTKLGSTELEREKLRTDRDRLQATLDKWVAAVKARDDALHEAARRIEALLKDRNDTVGKFNDLAAKYNLLVKDWNTAQAKASGH